MRNKLDDDNRSITLDEEREYVKLKNELIEIQLNAKEGLTLLSEAVMREAKRMEEEREALGKGAVKKQ